MEKDVTAWKKGPAFVEVLRKLHELSIRIHRVSLAEKMNRTKAMLDAMVRPRV